MQGPAPTVVLQCQHTWALRVCGVFFHYNCCIQSGDHLAQDNIICCKFSKAVPRYEELAFADEINDAVEQGIHRDYYSAALSFFAGASFSAARPLSSGFRYCPV
jgi:hypothetical protein